MLEERESGREEGRDGGKEVGREGRKEGGREGGRKKGRVGGREIWTLVSDILAAACSLSLSTQRTNQLSTGQLMPHICYITLPAPWWELATTSAHYCNIV